VHASRTHLGGDDGDRVRDADANEDLPPRDLVAEDEQVDQEGEGDGREQQRDPDEPRRVLVALILLDGLLGLVLLALQRIGR
jgi:hypothetical protein